MAASVIKHAGTQKFQAKTTEINLVQQIESLTQKLTQREKIEMIQHLALQLHQDQPKPKKKLKSARGMWKGKFPKDFDIESCVREIRDEWKKTTLKGL